MYPPTASTADVTKQLRVAQFQILGVALWRRATLFDRAEGSDLLQSQLLLARREAAVAVSRAENWERTTVRKGAGLRWGLMAAALLRKRDRAQREEMDDVVYALTQKTLQLQLAVAERAASAETLHARESELSHIRSILASLRREHAAALRQLQQEHGLRREISDMVKHDGMAAEPTVSEVQSALGSLAAAVRGAANLARTAGDAAAARVVSDATGVTQPTEVDEGGDGDDDRGTTLLQQRASAAASEAAAATEPGPEAEWRLAADLEECRDALLIMDDEDDTREIAASVAASRGPSRHAAGSTAAAQAATADRPLTEYEQAARKVRRHFLEVKAECLASLVAGVEQQRNVARLQYERGDYWKQLQTMRAAAVASKFKRNISKSKDDAVLERRAEVLVERKAEARGRWSAGLAAHTRLRGALGGDDGSGGIDHTPSPPPQRAGRRRMSVTGPAPVVAQGGGARPSSAGPITFSGMMRAAKARAATDSGGGEGGGGTGGGGGTLGPNIGSGGGYDRNPGLGSRATGVGPWDSRTTMSPPVTASVAGGARGVRSVPSTNHGRPGVGRSVSPNQRGARLGSMMPPTNHSGRSVATSATHGGRSVPPGVVNRGGVGGTRGYDDRDTVSPVGSRGTTGTRSGKKHPPGTRSGRRI